VADKLLMGSNEIKYKGVIEACSMDGVLAWIPKGKRWDANLRSMRDQQLEVLIGKEVLHLIWKPKILYWTL
jgi:hypothetical protein